MLRATIRGNHKGECRCQGLPCRSHRLRAVPIAIATIALSVGSRYQAVGTARIGRAVRCSFIAGFCARRKENEVADQGHPEQRHEDRRCRSTDRATDHTSGR